MTDLIKRIDALNAVAKAECGQRFNFEKCLEDGCSCSYVWAIKDCPAVEVKNDWIPVSKKLPDEHDKYFVTCQLLNKRYITTAWYGTALLPLNKPDDAAPDWYITCDDGDYYIGTVIAWQPLPEPYKEGGSDV